MSSQFPWSDSKIVLFKVLWKKHLKALRPLKEVSGSEHQIGTQIQSYSDLQSSGTKIRLTKKTLLKEKAPSHPTKGHSVLWFLQGCHPGACHRLNKPSLFKGKKQRLPPGPRGMPPVLRLLELEPKKDSNVPDYLFKGEFAWGKCAAVTPKTPPNEKINLRSFKFLCVSSGETACLTKEKYLKGRLRAFGDLSLQCKEVFCVQFCLECQEEIFIPISHEKLLAQSLLSRFLHSFFNGWFAIGNWVVLKKAAKF